MAVERLKDCRFETVDVEGVGLACVRHRKFLLHKAIDTRGTEKKMMESSIVNVGRAAASGAKVAVHGLAQERTGIS